MFEWSNARASDLDENEDVIRIDDSENDSDEGEEEREEEENNIVV